MADGTIPPDMHEKYLKIILFETERLTDTGFAHAE